MAGFFAMDRMLRSAVVDLRRITHEFGRTP